MSHLYVLFKGGATSAGVMKGLQAVLVFLFSSLVYCHPASTSIAVDSNSSTTTTTERKRFFGGQEMCFTMNKLISLVVVLSGVMIFAIATDGVNVNQDRHLRGNDNDENGDTKEDEELPLDAKKKGYQSIQNLNDDKNVE